MPSVLHIYKDFYPPVMGGIEKHINLVALGAMDDYEVSVLVANTRARTEIEEYQGVRIIKAASLGRFASAPICPTFPRLMKTYAADILHFHCPNPTGDVSYLISRPPGKVVVTYHSDIVRQKWALFAYSGFLKRFLKSAEAIMPTSPVYIETSPFLREVKNKCFPVPLGIDTARFIENDVILKKAEQIRRECGGGPIILFVGRLRLYKGLRYLVQALPLLKAQLLIVGSGPEEKALRKMASVFKVEKKVHLAGSVSDEDLPAYYHASDIFCLPSHLRSEAYGLVQLEAMACGLPVVSCDIKTGVAFVNQNEETGFIVPPASPAKLADGIKRLLDDEGLRIRLGAQAKKRTLEKFDTSHMIEKIKKVYKKVLR